MGVGKNGDPAPVVLPPVLLDGPSGVGKTVFVKELAKLWKTGFEAIDMASAQTNAALCGLDHSYVTSRPGALFTSLVLEGETANPVIFLDELEKARGDERYNCHNALLNLLQKHSAEKFKDLSLPGLPINASHVLWIANKRISFMINEYKFTFNLLTGKIKKIFDTKKMLEIKRN